MRVGSCWRAAPLLALACAATCRADADYPAEVAPATPDPIAGVHTPGSGLVPTLTRSDLSVDGSPGAPGWREQATELDYRWWSTRGRTAIGFGLGTVLRSSLPIGLARPTAGYVPGIGGDARPILATTDALAVVSLGLRYRADERSTFYADAAGVPGTGGPERDAVYGKVGLEFKAAQSRWDIGYGGLGMRLSGDTGMTLRLRKGGLALLMRSSF